MANIVIDLSSRNEDHSKTFCQWTIWCGKKHQNLSTFKVKITKKTFLLMGNMVRKQQNFALTCTIYKYLHFVKRNFLSLENIVRNHQNLSP